MKNSGRDQQQIQHQQAQRAQAKQQQYLRSLQLAQKRIGQLPRDASLGRVRSIASNTGLRPADVSRLVKQFAKTQPKPRDIYHVEDSRKKGPAAADSIATKEAADRNERSIARAEKAARRADARREEDLRLRGEHDRGMAEAAEEEDIQSEISEAESSEVSSDDLEPTAEDKTYAEKLVAAAEALDRAKRGAMETAAESVRSGRLGDLSGQDATKLREAAYALGASPKNPEHIRKLLDEYAQRIDSGALDSDQIRTEIEQGTSASIARQVEVYAADGTKAGLRRAKALAEHAPEEAQPDLQERIQESATLISETGEADLHEVSLDEGYEIEANLECPSHEATMSEAEDQQPRDRSAELGD